MANLKTYRQQEGFHDRKSAVPSTDVPPLEDPLAGYIFVCNNETMEDDIKRELFGLPQKYHESVRGIQPGMPLFLYNYTTHHLHGVFEASSEGGLNLDPSLSKFPSQVRVRLREQRSPLDETKFRRFLYHYDGPKFRLELSLTEANNLLRVFGLLEGEEGKGEKKQQGDEEGGQWEKVKPKGRGMRGGYSGGGGGHFRGKKHGHPHQGAHWRSAQNQGGNGVGHAGGGGGGAGGVGAGRGGGGGAAGAAAVPPPPPAPPAAGGKDSGGRADSAGRWRQGEADGCSKSSGSGSSGSGLVSPDLSTTGGSSSEERSSAGGGEHEAECNGNGVLHTEDRRSEESSSSEQGAEGEKAGEADAERAGRGGSPGKAAGEGGAGGAGGGGSVWSVRSANVSFAAVLLGKAEEGAAAGGSPEGAEGAAGVPSEGGAGETGGGAGGVAGGAGAAGVAEASKEEPRSDSASASASTDVPASVAGATVPAPGETRSSSPPKEGKPAAKAPSASGEKAGDEEEEGWIKVSSGPKEKAQGRGGAGGAAGAAAGAGGRGGRRASGEEKSAGVWVKRGAPAAGGGKEGKGGGKKGAGKGADRTAGGATIAGVGAAAGATGGAAGSAASTTAVAARSGGEDGQAAGASAGAGAATAASDAAAAATAADGKPLAAAPQPARSRRPAWQGNDAAILKRLGDSGAGQGSTGQAGGGAGSAEGRSQKHQGSQSQSHGASGKQDGQRQQQGQQGRGGKQAGKPGEQAGAGEKGKDGRKVESGKTGDKEEGVEKEGGCEKPGEGGTGGPKGKTQGGESEGGAKKSSGGGGGGGGAGSKVSARAVPIAGFPAFPVPPAALLQNAAALHGEVLAYAEEVRPPREARVSAEQAVACVRRTVRSLWEGADVEVFGSFATGLALAHSDVDVAVINAPPPPADLPELATLSGARISAPLIRQLAAALKKQPWCESLHTIETARIPVIKLKCRPLPPASAEGAEEEKEKAPSTPERGAGSSGSSGSTEGSGGASVVGESEAGEANGTAAAAAGSAATALKPSASASDLVGPSVQGVVRMDITFSLSRPKAMEVSDAASRVLAGKLDEAAAAHNGSAARELVIERLKKMPALAPLVLLMKSYLHHRGLKDVYTGGLGSFSLTMMLVFYLERAPVACGMFHPPAAAPAEAAAKSPGSKFADSK
ncbi:unnamed protein product, partial [Closterium sp. NIES-65]